MRQRFPRRTRPLVAAAGIMFASFGIGAAAHVARHGPDLYARLAVIQVFRLAPEDKERDNALAFLRKLGPRAVGAVASRAREGPLPDELFAIVAEFAGEGEIDVLAGSVVGTGEARRKAAVGALARIHSEAAARAAGPALADPSLEICALAHDALRGHPEEILRSAVEGALNAPSFHPEFTADVLVEEGLVAAAVEPVAVGLRSGEMTRIYNSLNLARALFPRYPPGAPREAALVAGIMRAIPRFQPPPQALAIEVLAGLGGPEALDALCSVATSSQFGNAAREKAIDALGHRPGPRATEALETVVRTARVELRFAAADALARIGKEGDAARWLGTIEKKGVDRDGSEALLRAISVRGDASLIPRLFVLAHTSNSGTVEETLRRIFARDVRASIPFLLTELADAQPQPLTWLDLQLKELTGHQSRMMGGWRTMDEFAGEREALKKEWTLWWNLNKERSPEEWRTAAQQETVGGLRSPKAVERAESVLRLIKLAPQDLEIRLAELMDEPEETVWVRVQQGLSGSPTPAGNDAIRARLSGNSPRAAARAARLLGIRGDRTSVDGLLAAAKTGDMTVRREAATALGKIGEAKASHALLPLLHEDDAGLRDATRDALGALADRAIEPDLLEGLRSIDAGYKVSCVTLLGRCGTRRAVRPLIAFFHDSSEILVQAAVRSFQALAGMMPPVLDPSELQIRNWEDLVERRQR